LRRLLAAAAKIAAIVSGLTEAEFLADGLFVTDAEPRRF
jgi:hypothetical protein